jgi:hypothetical protein
MGHFRHLATSKMFSPIYSKLFLTPRNIYCLLLTSVGAACAITAEDPSEREPIVKLESAFKNAGNGIALPNGLNLGNGFNPGNGTSLGNGLDLSNGSGGGLPNGIDVRNGSIAPPSGSDLERWIDVDPTIRKRTIKYLTECALPSTKSVKLTYHGSSETYTGALNLGPGWASGTAQMTTDEQERVSACLLSRINASGAVVTINLVGPSASFGQGWDTRSSSENASYPQIEAAFAGNVFLNPPKAFACGAGPFSTVPANPSSSDDVEMCGSRACDSGGSESCTTSTCWEDPVQHHWMCRGACAGIIKFHTNCYDICSQANTYNGGDPYFYSCSDAQNSRTWTHVMTSYIVRHGYDHDCSGDWECTSQSCGTPWYGGTQKKCQ